MSVSLSYQSMDYKVCSLVDGFLLLSVFHLSQEQDVKKQSVVTVAKVFERYCDNCAFLEEVQFIMLGRVTAAMQS